MSTWYIRSIAWKLAMAVCVLIAWSGAADGAIYGIKSKDPISDPPTRLFRVDDDGSNLTVLSEVKLNGLAIDADGLAQDGSANLFAFEVTTDGTSSRLLSIDPLTSEATAIGPALAGRDIRGAVYDALGRLVVLDAANDSVLRINPLTGQAVAGSEASLTESGGGGFTLGNVADLTQRSDGSFVMVNDLGFYELDLATATVTELFVETAAASHDGRVPTFAGLATTSEDGVLLGYDVTFDDDLWLYDEGNGYDRTLAHQNIISAYNAGRGDLASLPIPEPATLLMAVVGSTALLRRRA